MPGRSQGHGQSRGAPTLWPARKPDSTGDGEVKEKPGERGVPRAQRGKHAGRGGGLCRCWGTAGTQTAFIAAFGPWQVAAWREPFRLAGVRCKGGWGGREDTERLHGAGVEPIP